MKLYSAISPSMNDQWSGKTLPRLLLDRNLLLPMRSSTYVAVAPPAFSTGLVVRHPRSQKLGPTGSAKSDVATR